MTTIHEARAPLTAARQLLAVMHDLQYKTRPARRQLQKYLATIETQGPMQTEAKELLTKALQAPANQLGYYKGVGVWNEERTRFFELERQLKAQQELLEASLPKVSLSNLLSGNAGPKLVAVAPGFDRAR